MTFGQYKTIIDTYLDFYPDERIDIKVNYEPLQKALDDYAEGKKIDDDILTDIDHVSYSSMRVMIYYPEITLTNDAGHHYIVKDIYLNISFPEVDIKMGRTTYNQNEINVGYRHSHIRKGNFRELSSFCTGYSDTPINVIKNRIRDGLSSDFKTDMQSFIIETERMIKIESNEGVPYITFESISRGVTLNPLNVAMYYDTTLLSAREKNMMINFIKYYCSLHLDAFHYDGRNYQLNASDVEFIDRVTKVAKAYRKTKNLSIYESVWYVNGLYFKQSDNPSYYSLMLPAHANWTFKGKHPEMKIESVSDVETAKPKTIVNPKYISILYSFLLKLINGVYANYDKYKDSIHSRAYKIKTELIKAM